MDTLRDSVGLPIGRQGCYFVGGLGFAGQDKDVSIQDYNKPPQGQPGLWCQWVPTDDMHGIVWDGGEKFYDYVEWLEYIVDHFLTPWGYTLNGTVTWQGEDNGDVGRIVVIENKVRPQRGTVSISYG